MRKIKISQILVVAPNLFPLLSLKSRYLYAAELAQSEPLKSVDDFAARLTQLVNALYKGTIGNDFIDALGALIARQLTLAYREAWKDEGADGAVPDYLTTAAEDAIVAQYEYVDSFYRDIVDAKGDKKPVDGLLSRVPAWANRYNENYNNGVHLITLENGGNEIWIYGDTDHCSTCQSLNGIVAGAKEWEALGVHPQGGPNDKLECGGYRCQCRREPTDKRRSPKAFDAILNAVTKV